MHIQDENSINNIKINKMREGGTTGTATLITGKVFETIFSVTL